MFVKLALLKMIKSAKTLMNALQKSMIVTRRRSVSILNPDINVNADVDLWNTIMEGNAKRLINVKLKSAVQRMLVVLLYQDHTVVFVKLALPKGIKSVKTLMNALQKSMIVTRRQSVSILNLDISVNADVDLWNTIMEGNAKRLVNVNAVQRMLDVLLFQDHTVVFVKLALPKGITSAET